MYLVHGSATQSNPQLTIIRGQMQISLSTAQHHTWRCKLSKDSTGPMGNHHQLTLRRAWCCRE